MRPLTDHQPKPLLAVRGQPLMAWPMRALARAGARLIVVNTDWLGEQIEAHFGDRLDMGAGAAPVPIRYSHEGRDFGGALETLGGIARALPLLTQAPRDRLDDRAPDAHGSDRSGSDGFEGAVLGGDGFWVVAGDVFMPNFAFQVPELGPHLGQLWLVPNPAHHATGDFALAPDGRLMNGSAEGGRYTFSGVGYYRRALFEPPWCMLPPGNPRGEKAPLAPLLRLGADNGLLKGSVWHGAWTDVGTPQRLADINAQTRGPQSPESDQASPADNGDPS